MDRRAQKTGLGEHLLMHALAQILRVSQVVGIFAVEVRAKNERARLSVKTLQRIIGEP